MKVKNMHDFIYSICFLTLDFATTSSSGNGLYFDRFSLKQKISTTCDKLDDKEQTRFYIMNARKVTRMQITIKKYMYLTKLKKEITKSKKLAKHN